MKRQPLAISHQPSAISALAGLGVCRVEGCGALASGPDQLCLRCREEIGALEEMVVAKMLRKYERQLADPACVARQSNRDAWIRRCILVFLFMLAGEGITSFALDVPTTSAWVLVQMGWALAIGALSATFCGPKGTRNAR